MRTLLEGVALLLLLALWAVLAVSWGELPDRIPSHFNAAGQPDAWQGRNFMFFLPVVAAGLYVLLTAVGQRARRFNLPFSVDQDDPQVRSELRQMLAATKTMVMALLLYIYWGTVAVAQGRAQGLGMAPFVIIVAGMPIILAYYLLRLRRYQRAG